MSVPSAEHRDQVQLRALAEHGASALAEADASEVLRWAAETFGGSMCVASNMEDAVLLELAGEALPGVEVLFLDTGFHFPETLGTRDAAASVLPVTMVTVRPTDVEAAPQAEAESFAFNGDPEQCCGPRKVRELEYGLSGYQAWITGLRRADGPSRAQTPLVEWDSKRGMVKINPLAAWSDEDMNSHIAEHGTLVNPLIGEGYLSIGCAPCTRKPAPGEDRRAGRWAGSEKTECGLHT